MMVAENIGLRGWIGEKIVKKWLEKKNKGRVVKQVSIYEKYPDKKYTGGASIDFGVIDNSGNLVEVYEVKTQKFNVESPGAFLKHYNEKMDKKEKIMCYYKKDEKENEISGETIKITYIILLEVPSKKAKDYFKKHDIHEVYFGEKILNSEEFNKLIKEEIVNEASKKDIPQAIREIIETASKTLNKLLK